MKCKYSYGNGSIIPLSEIKDGEVFYLLYKNPGGEARLYDHQIWGRKGVSGLLVKPLLETQFCIRNSDFPFDTPLYSARRTQ